ncbi:MAG TPA: hypothetical protein VK545_09180, partial [Streptomyces sp.]|nr:hypothetical protein [Streptomyces sp.]
MRQLTGVFIAGLVRHTGGPVIVPMTVLNPAYAAEVSTPAPPGRRLPPPRRARRSGGTPGADRGRPGVPGDAERSEAVRAYRRRRAPDYHRAAAEWMHADGHVVDTSALTPEQTRQAALDHLHLPAPRTAPTTGGTRGMTFTIDAVPTLGRGGRRPSTTRPGPARGAWS